jgi:hypothetical protein
VDDLVCVARDDELPRYLERPEHERKLHVGEVLHFVDRDEVVDWLHLRQPGMGDEVRLVQVLRDEPGAVAFASLRRLIIHQRLVRSADSAPCKARIDRGGIAATLDEPKQGAGVDAPPKPEDKGPGR